MWWRWQWFAYRPNWYMEIFWKTKQDQTKKVKCQKPTMVGLIILRRSITLTVLWRKKKDPLLKRMPPANLWSLRFFLFVIEVLIATKHLFGRKYPIGTILLKKWRHFLAQTNEGQANSLVLVLWRCKWDCKLKSLVTYYCEIPRAFNKHNVQ